MAIVRYLVSDVDESIAFYETLGFEVSERWGPPFAILQKDDLHLWISGPGTSAAKQTAKGETPVPGGWNRIVIAIDELDEVVLALRESGHRFRTEPIVGPGGRQVLIEDPSGNPIELFESKRT